MSTQQIIDAWESGVEPYNATTNYNVQIACGPPRHNAETLAEYLNRTSKKPIGVWDEERKTYILPSGTVKQGRRPMFTPFPTS